MVLQVFLTNSPSGSHQIRHKGLSLHSLSRPSLYFRPEEEGIKFGNRSICEKTFNFLLLNELRIHSGGKKESFFAQTRMNQRQDEIEAGEKKSCLTVVPRSFHHHLSSIVKKRRLQKILPTRVLICWKA